MAKKLVDIPECYIKNHTEDEYEGLGEAAKEGVVPILMAAIKFADRAYYAGCNKNHARTVMGAQLYKSKKAAETMMAKSINFHDNPNNPCHPVTVYLAEAEE